MFNVGDSVQCVDNSGNSRHIEVGKIYTVRMVDENEGTLSVDGFHWFYNRRFKLVNNNSPYVQWEALAMGVQV